MSESENDTGELIPGPNSYRYNLDCAEDYITIAETLEQSGRVDEAIDVMREGTSRFAESARLHRELGEAIFAQLKENWSHLEIWEDLAGQEALAEEAVSEFQAAVERDPKETSAYNYLASLYALRGRRREAIETYEKSLAIDGSQTDIRSDLELYRSKLSGPKELEGLTEDQIDTQL
jgi:tetratricopeptide (TPR) repeat protein